MAVVRNEAYLTVCNTNRSLLWIHIVETISILPNIQLTEEPVFFSISYAPILLDTSYLLQFLQSCFSSTICALKPKDSLVMMLSISTSS